MKTISLYFYGLFFLLAGINYSQIHQIQKLIPDDQGAWFGSSVAIDGNYAVVGCPLDNTNGTASGSAYIYDIAENLQIKIIGSDVDADDLFGSSVAIDGQRVVIGSPHSGSYWEGAIYIFKRGGTGAWIEDTTIRQSSSNLQFGSSVSISGSQIIAGTIEPSAYIYRYKDDHWLQDTIITLDDQNVSQVAKRVCINNNFAAIGDPRNGEMGLDVGAVYIYEDVGDTVWTFRQKLFPIHSSSTMDWFSISLSFYDNLLVVGAPHHMDSDTLQPSGAVYIFERDGSFYKYSTLLSKSEALPNDAFGQSVDISNNLLLVGALNSPGPGHAYLYKDTGDSWNQMPDTIKSSDYQVGDQFGANVALSENYIIIGAYGHNPVGMYAKGAAYLFSGFVTSNEEVIAEIPVKFYLSQNYPNPFNPTTKIRYSIPQSSNVFIKVFDVLGNEIETLVNEEKPAGSYEVEFSAVELSTGIYFYQLKVYPADGGAGNYFETKKMILIK